MSFDLGDYVDVAERIRIFRDKYPDGCLQSEITFMQDGVFCRAYAYRTADTLPGIGHSFLKIPGSTPYTRDSEVENVETSAWGRAIVAALAADTKKVASADEVRAKSGGDEPGGSTVGAGGTGAAASASAAAPDDFTWPFGKHKGKTLAETPGDYLDWFEANGKADDIKEIIAAYRCAGSLDDEFAAVGATLLDEDIPFAVTIDGLGN